MRIVFVNCKVLKGACQTPRKDTPRFQFTNPKLNFLSCPNFTLDHLSSSSITYDKLKLKQQNKLSLSDLLCVWPEQLRSMVLLDLEAEAQTRGCFPGNLLILNIVLASINGMLATIAFSQVTFVYPFLCNLSILCVSWLYQALHEYAL